MENYKKKTVELASNLALEYKGDPRVIPYTPSKTEIMSLDKGALPHATPESHGISSAAIYDMLTALESEESANVHSIVVAKDGEIIAKAAAPGYSVNLPHLSHSMSKSVTGMLIMLLCDDEKLDTGWHVCDFFEEIPTAKERYADLTVEHLLTMSSGVTFSEVGSVTESDWVRGFLESSRAFPCGEGFAYNSMNSYMLMRIADKVIRREYGISTDEFLEDRLFSPLGINNYLWERDSHGVFKGGWGLYLSTESWARIGTMMMRYGVYDGKRILSENSVVRMTTTHKETPKESGNFNYGYQVWVSRDGSDFLFNGMLGQNVWVSPAESTVVAINSGNNELFQDSAMLSIIRDHMSGSGAKRHGSGKNACELERKCKDFFTLRQWLTLHASRVGLPYALGLRNPMPFLHEFSGLIGEYIFQKNNQGILPLFTRVMQNNYQGGIVSFTFERRGDVLRMTSREGDDEMSVDVGFYRPIANEVSFSGEKYIVLAAAEFAQQNGMAEYKLELTFPELPNVRRMILTQGDGRLTVKMHEIPDNRITDAFVDGIPTMNGRGGPIFELLENNLGRNFIRGKLRELFSPELIAFPLTSPTLDADLKAENEKIDEHIESSRLVRTLVFYALGINDTSRSRGGAIISDIIGRILDRDS